MTTRSYYHFDWEVLSLELPRLTAAARTFLLDMQIGNYAESTITAYETQVARFAEYAAAHSFPDLTRLTTDTMRGYFAYLKTRPYRFGTSSRDQENISDNYFETIFRRLSRFFNYCVEQGLRRDNPMDGLPRPKAYGKTVPLVSDEDFIKLLGKVDPRRFKTEVAKTLAIRDSAAFLLLRDTPSRREELANLCLPDINLQDRFIHVTGKGRKERLMYLGETSFSALCDYLEARQRLAPKTDRLWVQPNGEPMKPTWLYHMLKRRGKAVGIPNIHPHMFRHTYVVDMINARVPQRVIEVMGGWERIPETYLRMIDEVHAGVFQGYFSPADRLNHRTGGLGSQLVSSDTWGMEWPPVPSIAGDVRPQLPELYVSTLPTGVTEDSRQLLEPAIPSLPVLAGNQGRALPEDVISVLMSEFHTFLRIRNKTLTEYLAGAYPGHVIPGDILKLASIGDRQDRPAPRSGRRRKRQS